MTKWLLSLAFLIFVTASPALAAVPRDYIAPVGEQEGTTSGVTPPANVQDTAAQDSSNIANVPWVMGWISQWWYIGLIFGFLLFIPWVVVGWEWWRGKFWVFSWPYPYWYWFPFIWFIPWLLFWWFGGWWFWWAWFWWVWPWVFWIGWWVIFLKHALMWVKSKK